MKPDWIPGGGFARATCLVFVLAVLLRLGLALVNSQANDDHISVIRVMAYQNRVPGRADLPEGFQPKLYHATVAGLWRLLPTRSLPVLVRAAQLVNCLAGVLTLVLVYDFLRRLRIPEKAAAITFSLSALNPALIGINAQATNDSFVILFATLALYHGYFFFQESNRKSFFWMLLGAVLAALSKGNGLVVFVAIVVTFATSLLAAPRASARQRRRELTYAALFLAGFLAVVPWTGPYWEHYRRYGSPFVVNLAPAPRYLHEVFEPRPGVTSIPDSYLTFRWFDLLRHPVTSHDPQVYPRHRTSLWTQLYGGAHFVHFPAHPFLWASHNRWVLLVGRLILVLALFPTALLLVGVLRGAVGLARGIRACLQHGETPWGDWFLSLAVFGYLAFIVAFTLRLRDFGAMKVIFILPALLGFALLFARECDRFYAWCSVRSARLAADCALAALLLLYTADVTALIYQLG